MKYLRKFIVVIILAAIVVGYYAYINNKQFGDASDHISTDSEVYKLISRDLDGPYYPEFPRSVVDFYAQITKAYYYYELTDKEIEALGTQARKLFDEELISMNPDEEFFVNLKTDISTFNKSEVRIKDYAVEKSADVELFTFDGKNYARVLVLYHVHESKGNRVTYVYQQYTLRKDDNGRWKILFWESVESPKEK